MQAAVLGDEYAAIYADDFMLWKCLLELSLGLDVGFRISVSWHQDGSVDDEEVGVGGRQPIAFSVECGLCHRQWNQAIGVAFLRAERL